MLITLAACSIAPIDYTGKQCPCPTGYTCNLPTQTCTKDPTIDDAPGRDSDSTIDAPNPVVSCLPNPRAKLVYSSPGFSDFPSGWVQNAMGSWSSMGMGNGVQQTSSTYEVAWLSRSIPTMAGGGNYRVVVTMKKVDTASRGPVGIAFRVASVAQATMYTCALDTGTGDLTLYYVNQELPSPLAMRKVTGIADPAALYTMEINATDNTLSCCIRDHDSLLSVPSAILSSGNAGPATMRAVGSFMSMSAYE